MKEHYGEYFKTTEGHKGFMEFNWKKLKEAFLSFQDSTVIELCLPDSKFTLQALFACLHAIETESPKYTKCYPQAMADAIGDLGVSSNRPSENKFVMLFVTRLRSE